MFSGIVTHTAKVKSHKTNSTSVILEIETPKKWKLGVGESVATDGACFTVKKIARGSYHVELMPETLAKTTFGLRIPKKVNLERSLKLSDRVSGHFVTGHIDTVGKIERITKDGTTKKFFISYPQPFRKFLAPKGSITVDGVSLTLITITAAHFSVAILEYTLAHTTLGSKNVGEHVNLEFDILAKYAHTK